MKKVGCVMRDVSSVLSCPASDWGHVRRRKRRGETPMQQWSARPQFINGPQHQTKKGNWLCISRLEHCSVVEN